MKRINDLRLEQVHCGERNKSSLYNEYDPALVDSKLEYLDKSDKDIFARYSLEEMKAEVNKKLGNAGFQIQGSSVRKIKPSNYIRTFSFAAAAVLVAAFLVPQISVRSKVNQTVPVSDSAVRTKGNSKTSLQVYVQKGTDVVRLKDGDVAGEGSVLQLSYNAGKELYGMIFSIDGNGTVTQHFPAAGEEACELVKDKEVPLEFAYELDDAPEFEKFYFVTSKKPFSIDNFSEKVIKEKKLEDVRFIIKKR